MKKLSRNFIWLFGANAIRTLVQLLIFIYLARTLLVEAFGHFAYAFTIVMYLMNFIDLGLSTYGIREIAKNKKRTFKYVSDIVSFRILLALCCYVIILAVVIFSKNPLNIKLLNLGMGLLLFSSAISTEWAFQGREKMHMVFLSYFVTSCLQFLLLFSFVRLPKDLVITPVLFFIAAIPIGIIFLRALRFRLEIWRIDFKRIRMHLGSSIIIWSISVFAQLYNGFDIVILGFFRGAGEVGYFTVARQLVGGVITFAVFLANAVLPKLSATFNKNFEEFNRARIHFLKVLLILGVFTILPLLIFTKEILTITVGVNYLPAVPVIRILVLSSIFVFFNVPFSTSLIAGGLEKKVFMQVIAVAIFSVFSNFILIPRFGMIGAAFTYLFTEFIALIWIGIIFYKNIKRSPHKS